MIKFKPRSEFQTEINYSFNVYACYDIKVTEQEKSTFVAAGSFIEEFGKFCIDQTKAEINNDNENEKIRFMVIHSDGYCNTAAFLYRILETRDEPTGGILYYPYKKGSNLTTALVTAQVESRYFINQTGNKICVIDCAEQIENLDVQVKNLYKQFRKNKFIFIFLSRRSENHPKSELYSADNWCGLLDKIAGELGENSICAGIIRSQQLYYIVKDYKAQDCIKILEHLNNPDMQSIIQLYETEELPENLCKPYFLDLLICEFRKNRQFFNNIRTTNELLNLLESIAEHSYGRLEFYFNNRRATDLGTYIDVYLENKDEISLSRERIANAWAKGIIHYCIQSRGNYYDEVLDCLFLKLKQRDNLSDTDTNNIEKQIKMDLLIEIHKQLVEALIGREKEIFSIRQYLLHMINRDRKWALICALLLLEDSFDANLGQALINECFVELGKKYSEQLSDVKDIFSHVQLGKKLGLLLVKVNNQTIVSGLNHLFCSVYDDYILPQTNETGISVIPVTNYEFSKFVMDACGYSRLDSNEEELHNVAVSYYGSMLKFVIDLLDNVSDKINKECLSTLLKGYDIFYYEQVAYIYRHRETIKNKMEEILSVNYPADLRYPTKWGAEENNPKALFCNPLQPVVGINIFEARAYAEWLSEKIGKTVRVLSFDPDYISVIGKEENGIENKQRKDFKEFLKQQKKYINTSEQSDYFYENTEKGQKEPAPVGMPNSSICGIYDLPGNIFEMQDTYYGEELEKSKALEQVYNCACGGLQRTQADLPPRYMGQILGFIRNQDCGFRIVINEEKVSKDPFPKHVKQDGQEDIPYSPRGVSKTFVPEPSNESTENGLLQGITIKDMDAGITYIVEKLSDECGAYQDELKIFRSEETKVMLICEDYHIFAYSLKEFAKDNNTDGSSKIKVLLRNNKLPRDSYLRKSLTNDQLGDLVDLVIIEESDGTHYYTAKGLSISNGQIQFGNETCEISITNKVKYYEIIKNKLGLDYYLPNWVDLAAFIKNIGKSLPQKGRNEIDNEIVTSVLTTIDTAYLHDELDKRGKKDES